MKTILLTLNIYLALLAVCLSAETPLYIGDKKSDAPPSGAVNTPRLTAADARASFYNHGEFSVDAFASTRFTRFDNLFARDNGGGIGVNWFPFRTAGLGLEAMSRDLRHSVIDDGAVKVLGRLPWDRFAFNFGLGSGFDFERDKLNVFAEVGPEFRFTKNIGAFANLRGVRPISGPAGEHIQIIGGLRLVF